MCVLRCFHTIGRVYFLSSPNCLYINLLWDTLLLCTNFCYSLFYTGISAWNLYLYIYKNTDIHKRLCHTAVHKYLFPSDTFSLNSWYTHSNQLSFPYTRITQVTITCYSFYVPLWEKLNTRQACGPLFTTLKPIQYRFCYSYIIINVKIAILIEYYEKMV